MASFGETLKRERELREISLRQISEATKINIRYLEALEQNRFDALPGGLFNKGFIRAYANFIGLDGEAMVNAYLQETTGRQRGSDSGAAGARASSNVHRPAEVPLRRAAAWDEGAERGARGERGERAERADRERVERVERGERADRAAHSERADRGERAARADRADRGPAPASTPAPSAAAPKHRSRDDRASVAAALADLVNGKPAGGGRGVASTADAQAHPAVTGIEVADSQEPASSRVLVWVLSLVAAAGVLFLIVSLMRGPNTTPGHSADGSSVPEGNPPGGNPPAAQGEGGAVVPGGADRAAAGDTSAVPPEVTSQSPLTIGGIAVAPTRPTPYAGAGAPGTAPGAVPGDGTPLAGTGIGAGSALAGPARAGSAGPEVLVAPRSVPKPAAQKSIAPPPATPSPSPVVEEDRRERPRAVRGPMKFEIEAVSETHVILSCDGSEVLNRIMEAGETERARCESVVRVSAADAGAVRASVNGQACLPLGEPGTRSFGYTIRIDDFPRICPVGGRDDDVRP